MRKIIFTLTAFLVIISGCGHKIKEKENDWSKNKVASLEKYVYIDKAQVLHSKNGCKAVYKDHNMQEVNPVEPECLSFENLSKVCSQCVTNQMIDSLNILFGKYRQSYVNVGNLYEDLVSRYDGLPSELQFRKNMRDHTMAKRLYQILKDKKANVGTYEEFKEWIGLSKPANRKTQTQL
jgi:hypothetical protein